MYHIHVCGYIRVSCIPSSSPNILPEREPLLFYAVHPQRRERIKRFKFEWFGCSSLNSMTVMLIACMVQSHRVHFFILDEPAINHNGFIRSKRGNCYNDAIRCSNHINIGNRDTAYQPKHIAWYTVLCDYKTITTTKTPLTHISQRGKHEI